MQRRLDENAQAMRLRRETVEHHQGADGRNPLRDEAAEECQNRNGLERAGLQSLPHHRHQASIGGNPGVTERLCAQVYTKSGHKSFIPLQR